MRSLFTFIFIVFAAASFGEQKSEGNIPFNPLPGPVEIEKDTEKYNITARFLAGLPIKESLKKDTILKSICSGERYAKYSRSIDKSWNEFFSPNREKISAWRKASLPEDYSRSVFYPFSGPDILHALTFYPEATEIIMFGLEPTGGVPDIMKATAETAMPQAEQLMAAINFTLNHAFFITTEMGKNIKTTPLTGVSAIMAFFLARGGYDILDIREIHIRPDGGTAPGQGNRPKGCVNGIEFIFSSQNPGTLKRARYFQIDIGNSSRQVEPFRLFVERYQGLTTIIKSASYLMVWPTFSKIRDIVLARSSSILQDDSGVPYRYLKNRKNWSLTYFGNTHPSCFSDSNQADLEADKAKNSNGRCPSSTAMDTDTRT
jgi:hypothetical protein